MGFLSSKKDRMIKYTIVDTETVGLKKPAGASGVVSVAWLEINPVTLEITDEFYSLVNPGCPIEPDAQAIHGISFEAVADKPYLHELFHVKEPTVAIGHNQQFDGRFLDDQYDNKVGAYCTLAGARAQYRTAPNHKLQTLADFLGLERGAAHNALGDCHTTLHLLRRIVADSGRSLEQLVKAAAKPKHVHVMPFGAHKGKKLSDLPLQYIRWFDDREVDPDLRYSFDMQLKLRAA